ncbi:MAG: hypothetical protein KGQ61_13155, partial [Planctomycetes bacterium]|nr:hypothetical protein [Planctomycetota bacterium]
VKVIVLLALLAGCGRTPMPEAPALDEQIAAVRAGRATTITLRAPVESPAAWARLGGLPGLRELVVERGRADDAAAAVLATLPDLERLVLRESPVGDAGLAHLAALPRLRDLNLPQSAATARGVALVAAGPAGRSLRSLRLGGGGLAGADVARAVARLVGLRSLHLIDVPIGDEGLAALAEMPGLWNLYLDGAGVSEGAWGGYFERRPDVHVHVDQVHHDRDPRPAH